MKNILVLGSGCPKCKKLAQMVEEVATGMGIDYKVEKVTDINQIMSFGVMVTPALVVDGNLKLSGKLPGKEELEKLLSQE